jgi:hypothetical protein
MSRIRNTESKTVQQTHVEEPDTFFLMLDNGSAFFRNNLAPKLELKGVVRRGPDPGLLSENTDGSWTLVVDLQ